MLKMLKTFCNTSEETISHDAMSGVPWESQFNECYSSGIFLSAMSDIEPVVDDIRVEPRVTMDMEYIERNPEAIFDYITVRSLQDRREQTEGQKENQRRTRAAKFSKTTSAQFQNELEFETFVQQFPIDDSIAECFAMTSDNDVIKQATGKFLSGGKRPQGSNRYNKLKKKFGWKHADEMTSEDDGRSRDSKRSKKGGVFGKRHKWRNHNNGSVASSKKSVNFSISDQSESETVCDVIDDVTGNGVIISGVYQNSGTDGACFTDATSITDSHVTSFSDTLSREVDQVVPQTVEDVYYTKPDKVSRRTTVPEVREIYGGYHRNDDVTNMSVPRDYISTILSGSTSEMIQRLEDMAPEEGKQLRDDKGNTLLHRCVLLGNADVIKYLLEKYPDCISDMNADNTTAVEMAAIHGQYECLRVMLDRGQKRKSLGPSLVNRLFNVAAQHGQAECLSLLMTHMSRDPHCAYSLPGDKRGNTAAHLAAKHGHLNCLQTLIAAGYDVTSENVMQQRPLHLAHQSRSQTCFEFLMVLNICEELMKTIKIQARNQTRHQEQMSCVRTSLEQMRTRLNLFKETHQAFMENKVCILGTLDKLHEDLERFIKHTRTDSSAKRLEARHKLDELQGEIERLADIFDFSPVSGGDDDNGAMTRIFAALDEAIQNSDMTGNSDNDAANRNISLTEENVGATLSSLVKDVHREFVLENWNIRPILDKHLGLSSAKDPTPPPASPTDSEVIYSDIAFTRAECEKLDKSEDELDKRDVKNSNNTGASESVTVRGKSETLEEKDERKRRIEGKSSFRDNQGKSCDLKQPAVPLTDITNRLGEQLIGAYSSKGVAKETERESCQHSKPPLHSAFQSNTKLRKAESHICVENMAPPPPPQTERPFSRLLSLEERMDMLIAGEREKEKLSDAENGIPSLQRNDPSDISQYTNSLTSITSESTSGNSDWFAKLDYASLETSTSHDDVTASLDDITSSSASYWWDAGIGDRDNRPTGIPYKVTTTFEEDIRNRVHLNLDNDNSSFEELRAQRLANHLRSVQQSRYLTDNYREQITTATGEVMGGFRPVAAGRDRKIVVDVHGALSNRPVMPVKPKPQIRREGPKLFSLEDAIATRSYANQSKVFTQSRDNSMTSPPWSEHFDEPESDVPWYEMSEYETGRGRHWDSDTSTSDESPAPQSYV